MEAILKRLEDIVKVPNGNAHDCFKARRKNVNLLLTVIREIVKEQGRLELHDIKDWGNTGTMAAIEDDLMEIIKIFQERL